jgi:glycerophosphoryl diester phosphodiesterase
MSELDVQLSSDGIPVVFHDENISRFSNENTLVSKLTAKELLEKVQAPSLEEVLRDPLGTSLYNIELKTKSKWSGELEKKVLSVVEMTNSQSRVLFSSFNPLSLYRLGRLTQRIPLALLVSNDLKEKYLREMWFAAVIPIHLLHLQAEMVLPEGELEYWLSRGVPVAVWTVNDPVNASQLLRRGALSIISDQIIRENK